MWSWTELQRHFHSKIRSKNSKGHPQRETKKENVQVVALEPAPAPHVANLFLDSWAGDRQHSGNFRATFGQHPSNIRATFQATFVQLPYDCLSACG